VLGSLRACFWNPEQLKNTFGRYPKSDISGGFGYNFFFSFAKLIINVSAVPAGVCFWPPEALKISFGRNKKVTFHVVRVTIFFNLAKLLIKSSVEAANVLLAS
jgi:hypothetical protein